MNPQAAKALAVVQQLQQLGIGTNRLCLDSRRIQRGDIFVALRGAVRDGRQFIGDAVRRGAAAVLYEAPGQTFPCGVPAIAAEGLPDLLGDIASLVCGRPSDRLLAVGITGTNGKTSVSQWIAQALNGLGKPCAVIGTLGNGFPGQLRESPNTTPDAIAVQTALAGFAERGAAACAMEVSSIGLDQGRVNGVTFDTAVLTNLSRDHLDYHASMAAYAAAKAKLFAMPGLKTAVLNLDDPLGAELAGSLRGKVRTIGYTLNPPQAAMTDELLQAADLRLSASGVEFTVDGRTIHAPVIGRFNVSNLLAVLGTLAALGVDAAQGAASLAELASPPGRLQVANDPGGNAQPLVVIDYAHTPDALDKALAVLREVALTRAGKLLCVFGCGGDRDPGKRPLMGAVAERLADRAWITSDNPRSEAPEQIASQIAAGMRVPAAIELDRAQAIHRAIAAAEARDVVLVAGKGHEAYQEIMGMKHAFSDIGTARRALEQRA